MNDAFNWWMLIVGVVIGAGVVWLVLSDSRRREVDVAERERDSEARWIADTMRRAGRRLDPDDAIDVLRLHAAYLSADPPDVPDEDGVASDAERWTQVETGPPKPPTNVVPGRPPVVGDGAGGESGRTAMVRPAKPTELEGSSLDR